MMITEVVRVYLLMKEHDSYVSRFPWRFLLRTHSYVYLNVLVNPLPPIGGYIKYVPGDGPVAYI